MRVNQAIADGSFFENPALRGAFERGQRVHLLGLVSQGGVHSHIDHLRALLRFAPEKTWIHAFTDGRDVSPHAALDDLATLPLDRIATVVGRYYAMDRDKRWERTQRAFDALVAGAGARAASPLDGGAGELRRRRHRRVHRADRDRRHAADRARRQRDLLQLPARPRRGSSRGSLLDARLRPDDDDALQRRARLPGRLRRADRRRARSPRCSRERGRAPAARRRDGEVRARHVLLQRRRRGASGRARRGSSCRARATCRATTTKPEMSADEVADALLRRDRQRLRLRGRQLREPGHGRPHRRDPGRRRGGRDDRPLPRPGRRARRPSSAASA